MKVTIVGTGYVGLVTGTCFAEFGHDVLCVDNDQRKVDMLKQCKSPIYEEGLDELILRNVEAGRLHFTPHIKEGVEFSEVIFIAVGTPPDRGGEADLSYIEQVGRQVAENMTSYRLLVEKSTVPVNTSLQLKRTMTKYLKAHVDFDVASNPEFLREGTAIKDALEPARIIVGVEAERAGKILRDLYEPIVKRSGCEYLQMSVASAELAKHASNSFLAMKISYVNAVSRICELTGADVEKVSLAMGLDRRIGKDFLKAGVGYGGSCFPKDADAFLRLSEHLGYRFDLLRFVQQINREQREHILAKIKHELWVLKGKTIAILGLAFKPGTDDIREAPSLFFVDELGKSGARLKAWDPVAEENFRRIHPDVEYCKSPMECVKDTDLMLLLTEWPELKTMNMDQVKSAMKCPVIIDGRNFFDPEAIRARGFIYHSVGRP